jgi:hypothetical protein
VSSGAAVAARIHAWKPPLSEPAASDGAARVPALVSVVAARMLVPPPPEAGEAPIEEFTIDLAASRIIVVVVSLLIAVAVALLVAIVAKARFTKVFRTSNPLYATLTLAGSVPTLAAVALITTPSSSVATCHSRVIVASVGVSLMVGPIVGKAVAAFEQYRRVRRNNTREGAGAASGETQGGGEAQGGGNVPVMWLAATPTSRIATPTAAFLALDVVLNVVWVLTSPLSVAPF